MEAEAREMSHLAARAADMSHHAEVAAQRSRRTAETAQRSRRAIDAADWSGCATEAAEMSRRATNAVEMSRRAATAWENFSWARDDCYRRMHAIIHSQMDQISDWARLQDDKKASFEQATGVIRQLREGNERLRAERDLLREKIVRSADQQEETSALLKKLMDDNDMLHNERQRLVEESVDVLKKRLEDTKELIAARCGD